MKDLVFYTVIQYSDIDAEVYHYLTVKEAKAKAFALVEECITQLSEVHDDNIILLLHDGGDNYIEVVQSRFLNDVKLEK